MEEENAKLKRLVAELSLERIVMSDVLKKLLKPELIKTIIEFILVYVSVRSKRNNRILET